MKAKKLVVGFIYVGRMGKDEHLFLKLAEKKGVELVMINMLGRFKEDEFEEKIKRCDLVYNSTAEDYVIESMKTVEELGKKVIEASEIYYYIEDKWMFYVKCREHDIPTPDTILLSHNMNTIRAELKAFGRWPVVLKRVYGTMGQFVEKADDVESALQVIQGFWDVDCDRLPIIAQEYIDSDSYRVTMIDKKIVQTAAKTGRNWKHTGVYGKRFDKFRVDGKLRKILDKVIECTGINICGVDLLKKDGEWRVLEVNSDPALDFIEEEHEKLVGFVLDFLKRHHRKAISRTSS